MRQSRSRPGVETTGAAAAPAPPVNVPVVVPVIVAAAAPRPAPTNQHNMHDVSVNGGNFECIVCLEYLDTATTILPTTAEAQPRQAALAAIDPTAVCATNCGHMYHTYCIEKWFAEQPARTQKPCPTCRKQVRGKLLRIFLNAQDGGNRMGANNNNRSRLREQGAVGGAVANNNAVAGGGAGNAANANGEVVAVPAENCRNPGCADLVTLNRTLVIDIQDLRESQNANRDELQLRQAVIDSLQESMATANREIAELKKKRRNGTSSRGGSGASSGASADPNDNSSVIVSVSTKRRRQT